MSSESRTSMRIAAEELSRRSRATAATEGEDGGEDRGRGRKRLFMAGRLGPDASRVRFGPEARAPVAGPWDLALVVRPR